MANLQRELALGYRILAAQGIGLGLLAHLTVREPGARTFWTYQLGQSMEEVRLIDLVELDFDLKVVSGSGFVNPNLAFHSEIYAARADVLSIVHHHGGNAVALGAIGRSVEPFDRNAGRWHNEIALAQMYESPVLRHQGASILASLGKLKALLLKHHGVLVTGECLADAVVSTIELEQVCGVQLKAMAAGELNLMPDAEIEDTKRALGSKQYYNGSWAYYKRALTRAGLDHDIEEVSAPAFEAIAVV